MEGKEMVQLYFLWQSDIYTFDVSLSVLQRCYARYGGKKNIHIWYRTLYSSYPIHYSDRAKTMNVVVILNRTVYLGIPSL